MDLYAAYGSKTLSLSSADFLNADVVNRNFVKVDENVVRTSTSSSASTVTTLRSVFEGIIPPPNKCIPPYANYASRRDEGNKYVTSYAHSASPCEEKYHCQFGSCVETFSEEHQLW